MRPGDNKNSGTCKTERKKNARWQAYAKGRLPSCASEVLAGHGCRDCATARRRVRASRLSRGFATSTAQLLLSYAGSRVCE
jgi:hypothetical protein